MTTTNTSRAAERDALLQAAIDFIGTLTGMAPPSIEVAPPEVFAPFRSFVDRVQAITSEHAAAAPAQQPAKPDFWTVCAMHEGGAELGWVPLPGYSNATEHGVKNLVLEAARKEGYKGTATGRLTELGWEIRPVYLARQPAPSTAPDTQQAALFDEHGFHVWVMRNLPDDTIIGSSAYWADHLTAWAMRFVKAAPTPQADTQPAITPETGVSASAQGAAITLGNGTHPAPALGEPTWTVFNSGAQVAEVESLAKVMEYLTPERLSRQWCAVCVVDQSNMPQARAPADSDTVSELQILAITTAYEQGVGKGHQAHESGKEVKNPYDGGWRCDLAWKYGYEEGKEQAGRKTADGVLEDAARLDHLQKTGSTIDLLPGVGNFYPMRFRVGGLNDAISINVREAIDAARAQQEKP